MRWLQVRVRTLMILVALVALSIPGSGMVIRAMQYHRLAEEWAISEGLYRSAEQRAAARAKKAHDQLDVKQASIYEIWDAEKAANAAKNCYDLAAWAKRRREAYSHAWTHPWEPNPPDIPFTPQSRRLSGMNR